MDKIKAKLKSLSQDRRYMIFVGLAIILNGFIGLASPGLAAFLGIIIGPFCLLVGYYGGDVKKGVEEFKKDIMDAKDAAGAVAKEAADKAQQGAKKAADMGSDATKKAPVKKAVEKK